MATPRYASFTHECLKFLDELSANNNREWFKENKTRYEEQVLDVALRFIQSMQQPLHEFAPHFTAIPKRMGGSLMRIYRDTRFSKDKIPYKTNIGIQFRHELGKDVHAPGYYLHIDNSGCFLAAGVWHPDSEALAKIRTRIAENPTAWRKAANGRAFGKCFTLGGASLKRPPRGFSADAPNLEDLKRKDFIAVAQVKDAAVRSADFMPTFVKFCKTNTRLMQFLTQALGVSW